MNARLSPMKIVYAGLQNDYYDPSRGESFEHRNFLGSLRAMPEVHVIEYPFDPIVKIGKDAWNAGLLDLVRREKPDMLFVFLYSDEFRTETLDAIRRETATKIVGWFADDYWRFWNYSRHLAPHLGLAITTSEDALQWYAAAGMRNAMLSQWAARPATSPSAAAQQDIDVSFVGQYKPGRARAFAALARAGVRVAAFGHGWPGGRLPFERLPEIFARSKVNLNIAARPGRFAPRVLARIVLNKFRDRVLPDLHLFDNLRAWWHFATPHIHARPFELAGSGAFVVSEYVTGMERYYAPDREIVFYRTTDELVEKTKYYLAHDAERGAIAAAGRARTLREHTYEHRFREIFELLGF